MEGDYPPAEDHEGSVASTAASSGISVIDDLACVLDPRCFCLLFTFLEPAELASLRAASWEIPELQNTAVFWLAASFLACFFSTVRRLGGERGA